MILLGIDPAISCGWCVSDVNEEDQSVTLIDCGFVEINKTDYTGDMCINLQNQIKQQSTKRRRTYYKIK